MCCLYVIVMFNIQKHNKSSTNSLYIVAYLANKAMETHVTLPKTIIAHQPLQLTEVINLWHYTVSPEGLQLYIIHMDAIHSACPVLIKHVELHPKAKRCTRDTSHYCHHYLLGRHMTFQEGATDL